MPFEEKVISNSYIADSDLPDLFEEETATETKFRHVIQNIFTPEDIEIRETLYCLWITE